MYFLSDEERKQLARIYLPRARETGVAEELRGWHWDQPPLQPIYDVRLGVFDVADHYCPKDRNSFFRRVEHRRGSPTQPMLQGRLFHVLMDEQFKMIRYYGVYSRRIKAICKKVISACRKEARKWIVKIKKTMRRRNWGQRIKEQTGKDPMQCPHCGNCYEYKGEVCLKEGQLVIKYESGLKATACLERMIYDFTGIKAEKTYQKEEKAPKQQEHRWDPEYSQVCLFSV